jgi:hypothetical protein
MTNLKASYPFGQELCCEATPDNTRLFSADGAAIAIFDVSGLPGGGTPPELADPALGRLIDPRPSTWLFLPTRFLYYQHPAGARYLFIAGGTMGLWRMELCAAHLRNPSDGVVLPLPTI